MSSQLQHKLATFEATPPKDAWPAIEDRLNTTPIQERLCNYEAPPPAAAWEAIEAGLDQTATADVTTPLAEKKWFRMAIAAAILGVIALGILTFAVQKPDKAMAKQPVFKQDKTTQTTISTTPVTTTAAQSDDTETLTPLKEESVSVPVSSSVKGKNATITKRYTVVAKEDGQIVRLSQKAYAVFDCAGKGAAQSSENCRETIQAMQAKMAAAPVSPTTDFAGLIDMIKTLEENK